MRITLKAPFNDQPLLRIVAGHIPLHTAPTNNAALTLDVTECQLKRIDHFAQSLGFVRSQIKPYSYQRMQGQTPLPSLPSALLRAYADTAMRQYENGLPVEKAQQYAPFLLARLANHQVFSQHKRGGLGYEITADEALYEGRFTLRNVDFAYGPNLSAKDRVIYDVPDAVTVLPYDPKRDLVLVLRQFRCAPAYQGDPNPWLLEPIGGIIEAHQTCAEAAQQEALEEAGLTLKPEDLHLISRYYPNPAGVAQRLMAYVALCDLGRYTQGTYGLAEEGEHIESQLLPFSALMEKVDAGDIVTTALLTSALWLDRHRKRLQAL